MVEASVYKDPEGMVRPIRLNTLLVAPSNADLAMRIVESSGVQGTPNVDSNPLSGKITVKTWERLEADNAETDKSAYWFINQKNETCLV